MYLDLLECLGFASLRSSFTSQLLMQVKETSLLRGYLNHILSKHVSVSSFLRSFFNFYSHIEGHTAADCR